MRKFQKQQKFGTKSTFHRHTLHIYHLQPLYSIHNYCIHFYSVICIHKKILIHYIFVSPKTLPFFSCSIFLYFSFSYFFFFLLLFLLLLLFFFYSHLFCFFLFICFPFFDAFISNFYFSFFFDFFCFLFCTYLFIVFYSILYFCIFKKYDYSSTSLLKTYIP